MKKVMTICAAMIAMTAGAQPTAHSSQLPSDSLEQKSVQLDEVSITVQKPTVKMDVDKITYSVSDDPDAKSQTLMDMLRKVPMVTVDAQDNITVNGSSSFQVYVNNKPNAMLTANASMAFKAIPAAMVKDIQVLTNPGAKYDAEGVGGILNIVFATEGKNMDGYMANIYGFGGNRANGGGVYSTIQKGDVTLTANVGDTQVMFPDVDINMFRTQSDGGKMTYNSDYTGRMNALMASLDLQWKIDKRNTFSANCGLTNMPQHTWSNTLTAFTGTAGSYGYGSHDDNRVRNTSIHGSVDFVHAFDADSRHTLTLAYRISTQPKRTISTSDYTIDTMPDYDITDRNNMVEHTLQADYVLPTSSTSKAEMGAKYVMRRSNASAVALAYKNRNDIGAVYGSYNFYLGNLGVKGGIRYEHTSQDVDYSIAGEDFSLSYDNLVPSLSMTYTLGAAKTLGIGYNMRITRPGISMLNPYVNQQNPISLTYGNPALEAERSNNLQMNFSTFTQRLMLNATLRYTFMNDGIEQYSFKVGDVMHNTYGNISHTKRTSMNLFMSWLICKPTRFIVNSTTTYVDLRSPRMNLGNSGWEENLMLSLQQELPWKIKGSATWIYNRQTIQMQGETSGMNMHTIGINRGFLFDRVNVGLTLINPFHPTMSFTAKQHGPDFDARTQTKMKMFSVVASLNIRLGTLTPKQQKTSVSNDDLIERKDNNDQMNQMFMQQR